MTRRLQTRLQTKMIAMIGLPTLVIYVAVLGYAMLHLRAAARANLEREMTHLADNYAARFDGAFREAAAVATTTARFMEHAPAPSIEQVYEQLTADTLQNPAIYGAAMAFEPATTDPSVDLVCPYVYRGAADIERINIGRDVYDWHADEKWQWWHLPKRLGRGDWCNPYFDEGAGNVLMVTFGEPFRRDGRFAGVATVDVMLPTLKQKVGGHILGDLDFVICTPTGEYVFNPNSENIMKRTIFDVATEMNSSELAALGRRMVDGQSGTASVDRWGSDERMLVFFAPIKSTGWSFAARMSEREAMAGANAQASVATIALGITLALIIASICVVSNRITRPLERLRSKVMEIAGGRLDARIDDISSRDELGDLAQSFNQMTERLQDNVERLAQERASREKAERDMDIAREIQRGLLPETVPSIPGFEIAGWSRAADKTGGDFFDWLQLPDGRLIFALADVSGHGIGPALIVAVCRAYMRASTVAGTTDVATAIQRVNELLRHDMPEGRFVTAVVGILDSSRSEMTLVSAGHAPLLYFDAAPATLQNWDADTLPLGVTSDLQLDQPRLVKFKPGDALILVTDGFFEWLDADGKAFGVTRLEEFVRKHHALPPDELIHRLHEEVVAASGGTAQADDLTALVIRRSMA